MRYIYIYLIFTLHVTHVKIQLLKTYFLLFIQLLLKDKINGTDRFFQKSFWAKINFFSNYI